MRGKSVFPSFLLKSILFFIASTALLILIVLKYAPSNPLIVGAFLFVLLVFLLHLFSIIWFITKFRGQQRVWYLKIEDFNSIYAKSLYLSLFISLFLFLKYIHQLNYISVGMLIIVLGGGYYTSNKK